MLLLSRLVHMLRNLVLRRRVDRDLDDEVRGYVDMLAAEQVERGLAPEAAARAARIHAGGIEQVKEHVRRGRAGALVVEFGQDLRYGARLLARTPGFAVVAILTLALGIGANVAIFSVLHAVLLRPLPFPDADRLVIISGSNPSRGWERTSISHANYWDLHRMNETFLHAGAIQPTSINLTGVATPERLPAARVTVDLLESLAVPPLAGRIFRDGEDRAGADTRLAVVSQRLRGRLFGPDAPVIGRRLLLDGESYRIVGVMPTLDVGLNGIDVFVPLRRRGEEDRSSFDLGVIGRLKRGVTLEQARADLARVAAVLASTHPSVNEGLELVLTPSSEWVSGQTRGRTLWLLMGAVGLLLLIACVNLSNMLLARASARTRETAVRSALGATHLRLLRQMLTESLLISGSGGLVGLLGAFWLLAAVRASDPGDIPRLSHVSLDMTAVAFAAVVVVLTSLVIGAIPALHAGHAVAPALRNGDRSVTGGRAQQRMRGALVTAEVALSLVLLIGAALLLRSLNAVLTVDRGFATEGRMLATVHLPAGYEEGDRATNFQRELLHQIASSGSVKAAAAVTGRPLVGRSTGLGIAAAGEPEPAEVPWASWRLITGDYFRTLGLPVLRGRTFDEQDRIGGPPRVIVSERVADRLWPGQDPLGRMAILWKGQDERRFEVIGVVGNMRERGLASDPTLAVYLPYYGASWSPMEVVLHTDGTREATAAMLRTMVSSLDPAVPVSDIETLDDIVAGSLASRRLVAGLTGGFAALALLLAVIGIYGVLAYSVSRRTAEIGVRRALGASTTSLVRLIVGQGLKPVALGLALGVLGAAALSRLLGELLFGVTPTDPFTYAAVVMLVAGAAVLACVLPASQAARLSVTSALRTE